MEPEANTPVTGRCYCGAITFRGALKPHCVAYCHCEDCRRATGGPVAAFAAFSEGELVFSPNEGKAVSVNAEATRTFCEACGSSLTGRYDYLPGKVYISIGVIDQAEEFPPTLHAHEGKRLRWLHITDNARRISATARDDLTI